MGTKFIAKKILITLILTHVLFNQCPVSFFKISVKKLIYFLKTNSFVNEFSQRVPFVMDVVFTSQMSIQLSSSRRTFLKIASRCHN